MKKIISYIILAVGSTVVVLVFVTATSVVQLIIATTLYILIAYLVLITFPRKVTISTPSQTTTNASLPIAAIETTPVQETSNVEDDDKRSFLKLISISGISLLFYWLFTKKGRGPLFGGASEESGTVAIQNIEGNQINPAESHATDGYKITEVDDAIIAYYGFTHKNDSWFIMRLDTDSGSFRYTRGESKFAGSWNNREKLKYDYYTNVF